MSTTFGLALHLNQSNITQRQGYLGSPLHRTIGQVKKSPFLVPTSPTKLGTFSTGGLRKSQWFSNQKENVADVTLPTTEGIIV